MREGNVYRLYSRNAFRQYMPPFEAGEMVRIPLDQVILSLRDMLGEAVTPILLECLEPPDIFNINRSFQSLHDNNFISEPTDEGEITSLGSLVVALGYVANNMTMSCCVYMVAVFSTRFVLSSLIN